MAHEASGPDLYTLLGVHSRACVEVIEGAYRALSTLQHENPNHKERDHLLERFTDAYDTLINPERRKTYDERLGEPLTGKVYGPWRILEQIAEGGCGRTYRGEHARLKHPVCLKHYAKVSTDMDEVLMNEVRAVWDLRHYAIPVMRDAFQIPKDGSWVIVMSYIPGPTLAQVIQKMGKIDPENLCWILQRMINALEYLSWNGVVHGDIKPGNIILQPEYGRHMAVLIDYGLAMVKPTATDRNRGYMKLFSPPEQEEGLPLIPQTDMYSLGMTAIYALSGNEHHAQARRVPEATPEPLKKFLHWLVRRDTLARPHPQKDQLCDAILRVRQESFGRTHNENLPPLQY